MSSIKVVIADDHEVVRHGLAAFLGLDADLEVIGTASGGEEALQIVRELLPQVLLLDLRMPDKTGFEVLSSLRAEQPDLKIIILSSVMERASIQKALRLGANGFLLKDIDGQALCKAIKTVLAKESKVQLVPQVKRILRGKKDAPKTYSQTGKLVEQLTPREKDVLNLIVKGLSNKQIAQQLDISEKTVKTYVSTLLNKLGAQSRTEATLKALQMGLLSN